MVVLARREFAAKFILAHERRGGDTDARRFNKGGKR